MTKLWKIDVKIYASAYIKADTAEQATAKARGLKRQEIEVKGGGDTPISEASFDSPELPDISLSPAMQIYGPDDDAVPELVEQD